MDTFMKIMNAKNDRLVNAMDVAIVFTRSYTPYANEVYELVDDDRFAAEFKNLFNVEFNRLPDHVSSLLTAKNKVIGVISTKRNAVVNDLSEYLMGE